MSHTQTHAMPERESWPHAVMFWLGVVYLVCLLLAMTPFTFQLDDLKIVVLHMGGPVLLVVWLAFMAMGWLEVPRRATLLTLGGYLVVLTVSTVFAASEARWLAWDGFWMQFALLGTFAAFFASVQVDKYRHYMQGFLTLVVLVTSVAGFLHIGIMGRPGIPMLVKQHYDKEITELQSRQQQLMRSARQSTDTQMARAYQQEAMILQNRIQEVSGDPVYKVANTLGSGGARHTMMSLILNRNFLASWLLLMIPFAMSSMVAVPQLRWSGIGSGFALVGAVVVFADAGTQFLERTMPESLLVTLTAVFSVPVVLGLLASRKSDVSLWRRVALGAGVVLLPTLGVLWSAEGGVLMAARVISLLILTSTAGFGYFLLGGNRIWHGFGFLAALAGVGFLVGGFYHTFLMVLFTAVLVLGLVRVPAIAWRLVAFGAVLVGVFCIYYSRSKVSMYFALEIAAVFMVLLWLFPARMNFGHPWRVLVIGVSGLALLLLVGLVSPLGDDILDKLSPEFVESQVEDFANPIGSRAIIWGGGLNIWQSHPVLGAGPHSFRVYFPQYRRPDYFLWEISHVTIFAHNLFIDLLAETGTLGFLFYVAFLLLLYFKGIQLCHRAVGREHRVFIVCTLGGITGYILSNVTSPNARWPIGAGNWWPVLGVMAGLINLPMDRQGQTPAHEQFRLRPGKRPVVWGLCLVAFAGLVWTSYASVTFFRGSMRHNAGLSLVGEPPARPGMVYIALNRMQEIQNAMNRNPARQAELGQTLERTRAEFQRYRMEAIDDFRTAIKYDPSLVSSYYKLGSLYAMGEGGRPSVEDYRKAIDIYEEMRKYAPDFAQVHLNLGMMKNAIGEPDAALPHLRRSVRMTIEPRDTQELVRVLLGMTRANPGESLVAANVEDPERLLDFLRSDDGPVARKVAEALGQEKIANWRKMLKEKKDALKQEMAESLNGVLADITFDKDTLEDEYALNPSLSFGLESEAENRLRMNRAVLAVVTEHAVEAHPADEAVMAASRIYKAWREIYQADSAVRLKPDEKEKRARDAGQYYLGVTLQTQKLQEAAYVLKDMERTGLLSEQALEEAVETLARSGRHALLEDVLESYLKKNPLSVTVRALLVSTLIDMDKMFEARKQTDIVARLDVDSWVLSYMDYREALAAGDNAAAKRHAAETMRKNPPSYRQLELRQQIQR